jgi:preprotein translocase subunit SecG
MFVFFTIVHLLLCVFMMLVILLQPGKDAGMGAALGGGAATSAFGGRGAATFLTKLTAFCAMAFFVTSLLLSFIGLKTSVSDSVAAKAAASAVSITPAEVAPASAKEAEPKPVPVEAAPAPTDSVTTTEKLPAEK